MKDAGILANKRQLLPSAAGAAFTLAFAAALTLAFPCCAEADDADAPSNLQISGFLSIVGGKTVGHPPNGSYIGPTLIDGHTAPGAYVADWADAGVYTGDFSFAPESRVGVQATYKFNDKASVTGQIVSRGTDLTPNVQWAYGTYQLSSEWEVQIGRKRIPLYYYSDFQDVGVTYPWVSPPPELYGWEVTNYNGASLRYRGSAGATDVTASVFAGKETNNNSYYEQLYYPGDTSVTWNNIVGGDTEINYGPLTARAMYLQANESLSNPSAALNDSDAIKAYGLAVNLDFSSWFVLSEITQLTRDYTLDKYRVRAPALTLNVGAHLGKWTPLVGYSQYREYTTNFALYQPQSFRRVTALMRYDIDASSDVKLQIDRETDITSNFGGNSNIVRISYDRSF